MKRKIEDELDIFMEVVPVTCLFKPENKGNAELHELFDDIYVSPGICRKICDKTRSSIPDTSVSIMHRDVFDREKNAFVSRLIAHAYSEHPHYAELSICADGFFKASCGKCCSKVGTYLDKGHIDICEHELELLLGIDLYMSSNGNYLSAYKLRRMSMLLEKQKTAHKKVSEDDPKKIAMLYSGMAFAGFDVNGFKCDEKQSEQIYV